MQELYVRLMNHLKAERGATAVEYGVMVAAIAAVIVVTVNLLGGNVHQGFIDVNAAIN